MCQFTGFKLCSLQLSNEATLKLSEYSRRLDLQATQLNCYVGPKYASLQARMRYSALALSRAPSDDARSDRLIPVPPPIDCLDRYQIPIPPRRMMVPLKRALAHNEASHTASEVNAMMRASTCIYLYLRSRSFWPESSAHSPSPKSDVRSQPPAGGPRSDKLCCLNTRLASCCERFLVPLHRHHARSNNYNKVRASSSLASTRV